MDHDAGFDADLIEGAMREVEADGRKLLLARSGGRCHAVGATCPHAGAPLHEGVLRDGVVTCPWHKAAFQLATGRRVEPPAVDNLPSFPARIADGRIVVYVGDEPDRTYPVPATAEADTRCMAIVGAGAAGAVAAQALREEGFGGRVVLIGREDRLPYDRTILSKYALSGQKGGEKTPLQDQAFYDRHRIERRTGEVTSVNPATRTLTLRMVENSTSTRHCLPPEAVRVRWTSPGMIWPACICCGRPGMPKRSSAPRPVRSGPW